MALPDYFAHEAGTAVVWGQPSATGVTKNMTLDALADAAGRMGVYADLGAAWNGLYVVEFRVETGTAPTAGNTVELYLAWSTDSSVWPGKVDGTDAAYPATVANNKRQLGPPVSILVATNDGNTVLRQNAVLIRAIARYVAPVVVNLLGQAFRNEATDADNDSRIILTPYRSMVQDTAP